MIVEYNFVQGANYMLQILMACNLFAYLLKRRDKFRIRFLAGMGVSLLIGGIIGEFFSVFSFWGGSILFYGIFMLLGIPYLWFINDVTWEEAIYCSVCSFAIQHFASELCQMASLLVKQQGILLIYFVLYIMTYLLFYQTCIKKMIDDHEIVVKFKNTIIPIAAILLISLVLSVSKRKFYSQDTIVLAVISQIYDMLCCFFVLWSQVLQKNALYFQRELDYRDYLWKTQQENYRLTMENIDIINRKCHDLKHQISALRTIENVKQKDEFIKSIEDAIMVYDASMDTGNKVLDTVLMEKSLYCKEHGILMTCMADGSGLEFLDTVDLYTIFGNALDNAIEGVKNLPDEEKRVIIVKIFKRDHLLMLQIENYYDSDLEFAEGLPVTTKKDKAYHGYGMKSIRYTVEKYNGSMNVSAGENQFTLSLLIPIPK